MWPGGRTIEPANIEEAWADLQQLPTPWTGGAKNDQAGSGGVIEFGSLDDQPDVAPGSSDEARTSLPMLRISLPAEDDARPTAPEPGRQIRRIERLLAEADDDFQPAGSIGPEIELCFEEAAHPFQEAFEHEEVVADRYAAILAAATPKRRRALERVSDQEPAPEQKAGPEPAIVSAPAALPDAHPPVADKTQDGCSLPPSPPVAHDAERISAVVRPTPPRLVP